MVSRLTLNFISFYQPLLMKSLGFFCLTYRAISDTAVFSIKRMSKLTMSFSSVYSTERIRVLKSILSGGNKLEMFYKNTSSVFTNMIYHHTFRYVAKNVIISKTVRSTILFSKIKTAISVLIKRVLPKQTLTDLFTITTKPIQLVFVNVFHVVQYIPISSRSQ